MPARKRWDGTSLHAAYQGSDSGSGTAGSPERGEPSCVTIVDIVLSLLGEPFEK